MQGSYAVELLRFTAGLVNPGEVQGSALLASVEISAGLSEVEYFERGLEREGSKKRWLRDGGSVS